MNLRRQPEILHQHRIHAFLVTESREFQRFFEFAGRQDRVQGNVKLRPVRMNIVQGFFQFVFGKIVGKRARSEILSAQINRVGSVLDRGA